MRTALAYRAHERRRYRATFQRFGATLARDGDRRGTVLLLDVRDVTEGDIPVADHVWLLNSAETRRAGELRRGDVLEFCATARHYVKTLGVDLELRDVSDLCWLGQVAREEATA